MAPPTWWGLTALGGRRDHPAAIAPVAAHAHPNDLSPRESGTLRDRAGGFRQRSLRNQEQSMAVIKTSPEETQTIEGVEYGATISLILDRSNPGQGPRLHRHPYDETWLVLDGTVNFQAGNETRAAGPGDVVIVPSNTPHKFTNDGPGRSRLVCIHANPTVIGEWLE
jgi:quercetin dioxygenase-like cupin family protein